MLKQPFNPLGAYVPPIPCKECGNNAHLVKRSPDSADPTKARQVFRCVACGHQSERRVGIEAGDANVLQGAEKPADNPDFRVRWTGDGRFFYRFGRSSSGVGRSTGAGATGIRPVKRSLAATSISRL